MADQHCLDCTPSEPSNSSPSQATPSTLPDRTSPSTPTDPLLDPASFEPPDLGSAQGEAPRVLIEFCDRCRWLHRATWTQTELFLTFPPASLDQTDDGKPAPSPGLKSISLVPRNRPETGGRFRVWLLLSGDQDHSEGGPYAASAKGKERWRGWQLVWDRKIEGRFPEMKELKQRIRNLIAPQQNLGHSDKPVSRPSADHQGAPSVPTPPSNTSAERHSSVPPRIAADNETSEKPGIDLAGLADQPLQPLTAADFEPKYRCM
ncbi:hypothetical protein BMF94_5518 [Rhodotorula taiwanensis]|uniref:Rdx family-domain-containing protein n=1 Tax=Rhodotorula taiwanensis TaxID=741276 RepID=A0A2S5B372_9BASI|nr:hypothetical protein BMF94_5518 [Rhodotorula taiwanensis]